MHAHNMPDEHLEQPLTERFTRALTLACDLHHKQARKGTQIPYVAHLLAVAGIALEHGAHEDEAIAAVLHDAVEDQGGKATLDRIRTEFGDAVAHIVGAVSDTDEVPRGPQAAVARAQGALHREQRELHRQLLDVWHDLGARLGMRAQHVAIAHHVAI